MGQLDTGLGGVAGIEQRIIESATCPSTITGSTASRLRIDAGDVEQIVDEIVRPPHGAGRCSALAEAIPAGAGGGRRDSQSRRPNDIEEEARRHADGIQRIAQIVRDDAKDIITRARCLLRLLVEPRIVQRQCGSSRQVRREIQVVVAVAAVARRRDQDERAQRFAARDQRRR